MKYKSLLVIAALTASMAAEAQRAGTLQTQRPTTPGASATAIPNASVVSSILGSIQGAVASGGAAAAIAGSASIQANLGQAMENSDLAAVVQRTSSAINQQNVSGNNANIELLASVVRATAALKDVDFYITGSEAIPRGLTGEEQTRVKAVLEMVLGDVVINSVSGLEGARVPNTADLRNAIAIMNDFAAGVEAGNGVDAAAEAALNRNGFGDIAAVQGLDACGLAN